MLNSTKTAAPRRKLAPGVTAVLLVGAIAGLTLAGTITTKTVHGRMSASDTESDAAGRFQLSVTERGERLKETLRFTASDLDAHKDDDGNRPTYDLILITGDDDEADLGSVRLRPNGDAKFKFRKRDELSDDFDGLEDFGGGTIELRDGDDVVLEGDIPEFLGAGDDPEPGDGATFAARNTRKLRPDDDDSRAKGFITAESKFKPKTDWDRIVVQVIYAGRAGAQLTVVAIDGDDEIELGTLRLRGRFKAGNLKIDTRKGDEIPGDGIGELEGLKVEVRNGDDVVLSGRFPTLDTGSDD